MSDYSIAIKIAGELASSFKSSLQGAQKGLTGLAGAAGKIDGSSLKGAQKGLAGLAGAAGKIGGSSLKGALKGLTGIVKATGKIGGATMKATAAGIGAATTAAVGLGTAAVNVGKEFETAMSQVSATMLLDQGTEEGKAAFQTLEDAARECGASTAFSATEAAEGLNYLALAGYDAEKAAAALPTVLRLAGAGAMELGDASDMVTDAMSALNIEATQNNLNAFADNLAMTASKSNTSVAQLGEAILTVGGTAQGLAGGTTELSASLGILADSGIKASEGGTHLRNMIMSLQSPRNKDAAELFQAIGLSAYDAQGNMRSLGDVFGDLNQTLSGASAMEVNDTLSTIFKQTDLAAARAMMAATANSTDELTVSMNAMLAESGTSLDKLGLSLKDMAAGFDTAVTQEQFLADATKNMGLNTEQASALYTGLQSVVGQTGNRFEELSGLIGESAGACQDMYDIQLDNLEGDLKILGSAASDLGISFYKDVNGPIREVTQTASNMVTQLNDAYKSGGMTAMLTEIGDCASQAVNGIAQYAPTAVNVGVDLVQNLVNGIAQNSGGIASAAGDVLTTFANGICSLAPQIGLVAIDMIVQLAQSFSGQLPQLAESGTQAIASFVDGLIRAGPDISSAALSLVQSLLSSIVSNGPTLSVAAVQLVGSLITGIAQMLPQLAQMGVQAVLGLVQGQLSSLPMLLPIGTQAITSFIGGLSQALPFLVQGGLQLISMLVQGAIQNLPAIAQAAVTIIASLAGGLISSLPMIFEAVTSIPAIILEAIFTTDWPSIGMQLVSSLATGILDGLKSIGSGVVDTIKGWFGGGDDSAAATESAAFTVSSYANGIQANTGAVTGAASSLSSTAFSGMDFTAAINAGQQSATAFQTGITEGMAGLIVDTSSIGLDSAALAANFGQAGTEGATALVDGFTAGSTGVTDAVNTLGTEVNTSLDATWQNANTETQAAMQAMNQTVSTTSQQVVSTIQSMSQSVVSTVQQMGSSIQSTLNGINLAQSGTNMMQGLVNGIHSMRPQVESAARDVAQAAANSVNNALQIHSPSRLMDKSGQFVDEGFAGGMLKNAGKVKLAARAAMAQPVMDTGKGLQGFSAARYIMDMQGGKNRVRSALDGVLSSSSTVNNSTVDNSSQSSPTFVYSPTYQINGNASKNDIVQAGNISQAEFDKRMKEFMRKYGRVQFA